MALLRYLENIISNNNRWFKICDKGDDTPAPSPESKKHATFILQVKSRCTDGAFRLVREHHKQQ
nr:unnamed protein product [Callosobruchus analis]